MMVASFWLTGRVGYTFPQASTCLLKAIGIWQAFQQFIVQHERIQSYRGRWIERPKQFVSEAKSMADIRFTDISSSRMLILGVRASLTDANSGVFGGRLSYLPDPVLDAYCIGRRDVGNVDDSVAHALRREFLTCATTAILQTTYGTLAAVVDRRPRVGYTRADYIGFDRAG